MYLEYKIELLHSKNLFFPKTYRDLRRILGMMKSCIRFLPHSDQFQASQHVLCCHKTRGIPWTPELDKSFQLCKDSHSIQQYVVESGQPIVLSLSSRQPNKYVGQRQFMNLTSISATHLNPHISLNSPRS